jgi:hypothetical protein
MFPEPERQKLILKLRDAALKEMLRNYDPELFFEILPHMLEKPLRGAHPPISLMTKKGKTYKKAFTHSASF